MRRLLCRDCLTALPCAGSSSAHGWRRTASVLLVLSLYTAIYHSFSHAPLRLSRAPDRNIQCGAAGRAGDSRRDWSRRDPRWRRWRGCCARSRWSVRRGSQHTAKICFLNYWQSAAVLGWPACLPQPAALCNNQSLLWIFMKNIFLCFCLIWPLCCQTNFLNILNSYYATFSRKMKIPEKCLMVFQHRGRPKSNKNWNCFFVILIWFFSSKT